MTKDAIALAPAWGYLQVAVSTLDDKDFSKPGARALLMKDFDTLFEHVKSKRYAEVKTALAAMASDADTALSAAAAIKVKNAILEAAKFAGRGAEWQAKGL